MGAINDRNDSDLDTKHFRAVKKASVLNTCYEPFSSQVYGETSFEQLQIIFDHLKLTEKVIH